MNRPMAYVIGARDNSVLGSLPAPPKPLYLLRKLDFAVEFWGVAKAGTFIENKFGEITSH